MADAYCKFCEQSKPVEDFPMGATILYICKSCFAHRHSQKVSCKICQKFISYGNMSKHMYVHTNDNPKAKIIVCECGKVLKEYSLRQHIKTTKHQKEMAVIG